jgi:hypothetical protein
MKSCAEGLSARFFSVAIPTGPIIGNSMGSALIDVCLAGNLSADRGRNVTKRPVDSRLARELLSASERPPMSHASPRPPLAALGGAGVGLVARLAAGARFRSGWRR